MRLLPPAGGLSARAGLLALAAAGAAGLALLTRRRGEAGRAVVVAVAAVTLAGLGLGLRAGGRAAASCAAALRTGDAVIVEGEPSTDVPAARPAGRSAAARWARLELYDVRLRHAGLECALGRLPVRVLHPPQGLPAGRRLRAVGEWRRYAAAGAAGPRAPWRYGAVYGTLAPEADAGGTGSSDLDLVRGLRRARARAAARLERRVPEDVTAAAAALVLADRSRLPAEVTRAFADAGLIHLLAISGLHVGLLAGGALWLCGIPLGRRARWPAAAVVTGAYVAMIGAPPAAVRAALLFAGLAATRARGSPGRPGDLAGWAAAASLVGSPLVLTDPGFQLSFAGFAGLLAGDRAARRLRRPRRDGSRPGGWARTVDRRLGPALRAVGASAGAFLLTAPIAAAHFGRVAPASVVSSLAGTPLVGLALAGLLPALLLPEPAGSLAAAGAAVPLRGLLRLAEMFAELPLHGTASPPDAVAWTALGLAGVGTAALLAGGRVARHRGILSLAAAGAVWMAAPGLRAVAHGAGTLLCSLDVGQGDAAVLRTRRGHWIVFDAGPGPGFQPPAGRSEAGAEPGRGRGAAGWSPGGGGWDAGARVVVPFLRARGARAVDLFVLSHPHLDHLGGAAALFEALAVRRVLDAGPPVPSAAYLRYLAEVEEEGARWLAARTGARLRLDEVELLVLGPAPADVEVGDSGTTSGPAAGLDPNEVSVAVRVRVDGGFTYLNTGDAPAEAEAALLRRWPAESLRADLLKLGHHGSRTSTSRAWLAATRPRLAVVSVGARNRYGHPHPSVLARLDSTGVARLWRTDREGTLCVEVGEGGRWEPRPG